MPAGISYMFISYPYGSLGEQGVKNPSATYLNLVAFWHFLMGMKRASFDTVLISEPEYRSAAAPKSMKSYADKVFGTPSIFNLNIPALAYASGK